MSNSFILIAIHHTLNGIFTELAQSVEIIKVFWTGWFKHRVTHGVKGHTAE